MGETEITLRSGHVVLMDIEEALKFVGISMWVTNHGYVRVAGRHGVRERYLHREITGADETYVVDHINGNKLDNRKSNLRVCYQFQNSSNQKIQKSNKSGVAGVYWCNTRLLWVAQISYKNKTISLGRYKTFEEAVNARRKKEDELQGNYSARNGVLKNEQQPVQV